ncbi:MAG: family 20 glycosylhydrolase [Bacteroidia bacterium]|nr:family 20 glycosylhydrolase [Bacteroidia bacterium]
MIRKLFLTLLSAFLVSSNSSSQTLLSQLPLIPKPVSATLVDGTFTLNRETPIYAIGSDGVLDDAEFLNNYLELNYGYRLKVTTSKSSKSDGINIRKSEDGSSMEPDAYRLVVNSSKVEINGGYGAGAFYGIQTLIQLLPAGKVSTLNIPGIEIEDKPRFGWRGMHLDVSRHFFPVDFIKKYLDYLASYKLNKFHWHLTDDQGWRIEIKQYPKLQEISAYRKGTLIGHLGSTPQIFDSIPYGGFYTQEEVKEIVNYAAKRHITVVPEIEMPGHALAALAAYPEYSCIGGPFDVGQKWGIFQEVFCSKEETFIFLENILKEVSELFPGEYIHVGGDECPKDRWKQCVHCQTLMINAGLKDEHELQIHFMNRIGTILSKYGKRMIGWDEILDSSLTENAAIMSWRGNKGGIDAARLGHDVVMAPYTFCYFDFYQSKYAGEPLAIGEYLPIEKVYKFEPIPDVLTEEESKHILGGQANIWTEYMKTPGQVEYMAMPRMAALSEILWSTKENRNYEDFTTRLVNHFKFLDFRKVGYSKAIFDIQDFIYPHGSNGGLAIELSASYKPGVIYYTINGAEPDLASPVYKGKIVIDQSVGLKARLFDGTIPRGREFSRVFRINLATGKEIILARPPHEEFSRGGGFSLVNGITGSLPWIGSDWLGWLGEGMDATIDLGRPTTISKLSLDVLRDEMSGIFYPKGLQVMVSNDGQNFTNLKKLEESELDPTQRNIKLTFEKTQTRWVRIVVTNLGVIPDGNQRAGKPAWLLVDEITID